MNLRQLQENDYEFIIKIMPEWWSGRDLTGMLPRLFFQHFNSTSLVLEKNGRIVGFLVGFLSQSRPEEAYIHFVGVDPEYRGRGQARRLYEKFFETIRAEGRTTVRAITAPVNKASIGFHTRLGFEIEAKGGSIDGIPTCPNYDGRGGDRVLFRKVLG